MSCFCDGTWHEPRTNCPINRAYQGEKVEPRTLGKFVGPTAIQGWVCQLCGRCNAPTSGWCPCWMEGSSAKSE